MTIVQIILRPLYRYPADMLDRLWSVTTNKLEPNTSLQTSEAVFVNSTDSPPVSVVQTSYVATSPGWNYNPL